MYNYRKRKKKGENMPECTLYRDGCWVVEVESSSLATCAKDFCSPVAVVGCAGSENVWSLQKTISTIERRRGRRWECTREKRGEGSILDFIDHSVRIRGLFLSRLLDVSCDLRSLVRRLLALGPHSVHGTASRSLHAIHCSASSAGC
jgi:hypothetical protein